MSTDPIRVLIVDDEAELRASLAKVLGRRGMKVSIAADGAEALALLAREPHDVVVLDLKMPGIDGLETLRRMAAARPAPRVIMLTGHGSVAAGLEAMRQQVFDFLLKPVAVDQLVARIEAAAAGATG
jgi:DNA-binding NtrC family response regulator